MPSWSQTLPGHLRFEVLKDFGNEAVLDKETGLVWEQTPAVWPSNWHGSFSNCYGRIAGDRLGWRLPTLDELMSLMGPGQKLPDGHPFTLPYATYWSATERKDGVSNAYTFDFETAIMSSTPVGNVYHVWCVRGNGGGREQ
jgi:hypothetical protein